jgi:polyhydroxybutyrate depolymerase
MRILKFAAAIAAGVVALGVAAYAYFIYSPDPTPPHLSGQVQTATIQVGSRLRSYVEYIPAQLPAGAPLVIALHGTTMDGALMRKFTGGDLRPSIFARPDGTPPPSPGTLQRAISWLLM